mmetsp:Transcript_12456/g.29152  ORF Transcript_12456/g.29152 Transcript_12456/m.29152 type:complete len:222 (+) Transcript_12456:416-1081(+)
MDRSVGNAAVRAAAATTSCRAPLFGSAGPSWVAPPSLRLLVPQRQLSARGNVQVLPRPQHHPASSEGLARREDARKRGSRQGQGVPAEGKPQHFPLPTGRGRHARWDRGQRGRERAAESVRLLCEVRELPLGPCMQVFACPTQHCSGLRVELRVATAAAAAATAATTTPRIQRLEPRIAHDGARSVGSDGVRKPHALLQPKQQHGGRGRLEPRAGGGVEGH